MTAQPCAWNLAHDTRRLPSYLGSAPPLAAWCSSCSYPGVVAGLLLRAVTGWETSTRWPAIQVAGLVLVVAGTGVPLHAFVCFVEEGIGQVMICG